MKKVIFCLCILFIVIIGYLMVPVEYQMKDNIWNIDDNYLLGSKLKDSNVDEDVVQDIDLVGNLELFEDIEESIDEDENIEEEMYVTEDTLVSDTLLDDSSLENIDNSYSESKDIDEEIKEDNNYEDILNNDSSFMSNEVYDSDTVEVNKNFEGTYVIKSVVDNKVIYASNGLKRDGTLVSLSDNYYNKSEIWNISFNDGYYKIKSIMNTDVVLQNIDNNIMLYKDSEIDTQKWNIQNNLDGSVSFVSSSGNCITSLDNELETSMCMGLDSQKFYLESYDKDLVYNGIDVSVYQGDIDWDKVSSSIDFVIIRAGFGDNWTSQDDKKLLDNVSSCEEYNIPYAVYFYSYALNMDGSSGLDESSISVSSEVTHMMRLLDEMKSRGFKPNLGTSVFYDMEDDSTLYLGSDKLTDIADKFCSEIENNGYKCGIYANRYWLTTNLDASYLSGKYDIWLAEWLDGTTTYGEALDIVPIYSLTDYSYWQFSSIGNIDGINGNVDLDLGYNIFKN